LPLLRQRFLDEEDPRIRLRLACGLAELGEPPIAFLVEAVKTAPTSPEECAALVAALAAGGQEALTALEQQWRRQWHAPTRARYAIVLLHLGAPAAAWADVALRDHPRRRTAFIHTYAGWHGDLDVLPGLLDRHADAALRSALSVALGTIDPALLPVQQRRTLTRMLVNLHRSAPDGGTHSATTYALRRWGEPLPIVEPMSRPPADRDWFVSDTRLTLIRIAPGRFLMGESDPNNLLEDATPRPVHLTRAYWMSDREIPVSLFAQFVRDEGTPMSDWPGVDRKIRPRDDCPVQMVSWIDAIRFCNWLSRREGLSPCYHRVGDDWRCSFTADGYRLPTEAEWEHACRAGTSTHYAHGDGEALLPWYASFTSNSKAATHPGGARMPNAWGLFDMHGNVWEWCWDAMSVPGAEAQTDPTGPAVVAPNAARVYRGGGVANSGGDWRSASRGAANPLTRSFNLGFRVVCTTGVR
jgi:formylglycine-generating enzyme required for sulfatase activity